MAIPEQLTLNARETAELLDLYDKLRSRRDKWRARFEDRDQVATKRGQKIKELRSMVAWLKKDVRGFEEAYDWMEDRIARDEERLERADQMIRDLYAQRHRDEEEIADLRHQVRTLEWGLGILSGPQRETLSAPKSSPDAPLSDEQAPAGAGAETPQQAPERAAHIHPDVLILHRNSGLSELVTATQLAGLTLREVEPC